MSDDWFSSEPAAPEAKNHGSGGHQNSNKSNNADNDFWGDDVGTENKPSSNPYNTYKAQNNSHQSNDDNDGWGNDNGAGSSNRKPQYERKNDFQNNNTRKNSNNNGNDDWRGSNDNQPRKEYNRKNNYDNRGNRQEQSDDGWGESSANNHRDAYKQQDRGPRNNHYNDQNGNPEDFDEKENERPHNTYEPELAAENDEDIYNFGNAAGVNFSKYSKIQVNVTGKNIPPYMDSFDKSSLIQELKENVIKCKFTEPTPCQKYSIPCILNRRDLMCCAQTGSGKTAAFLLPILDLMKQDETPKAEFDKCQASQALILCPTRELAIQTFKNTTRLARNCNLRAVMVYGGTTSRFQMSHVEQGANIVIATVGRLDDLVKKRKIDLDQTRYVVLDEADRMLDMGFSAQVKQLVARCHHPERQIMMFSATFPTEIQRMAAEMMQPNYIFVAIGIIGAANPDITQTIIDIGSVSKLTKIQEILEENRSKKILIFVKMRKNADFLAAKLSTMNFNSTSIHGDRLQDQRELALSEFDSGKRNVLVATSVASRGLDIPAVDMVINYDMPDEIGDYVHRIGRTGRVGNCGHAVTFIDRERDASILPGLMKTLQDSQQEIPAWLSESTGGNFAYVDDTFNATRDIREYSQSIQPSVNDLQIKPSGTADDAWLEDKGNNNDGNGTNSYSKPAEVNMGGGDMEW